MTEKGKIRWYENIYSSNFIEVDIALHPPFA
jgi:hypothetical protein